MADSAAGDGRPRPSARSGWPDRAHDEAAMGLVALAVRLDVGALAEVGVDDLALGGGHRLELDGLAVLERLGRGAIRIAVERLSSPLAVTRSVHDDHLPRLAVGEGDTGGEILQGVDGGAMTADERTEVVAVDGG